MPYGMVCFLLAYDCIYPEVVAGAAVAVAVVDTYVAAAAAAGSVDIVELRKGFVKLKDIQV